MTSICSSQPTPIAPLISLMPIELVGVIGRCVHKQREQRHASVQELARALLPFARTAAARVSVERVLGMQPAPPPQLPAVEKLFPRRSSVPSVTTDNIVLGPLRPSAGRRAILGVVGGVCLGVAGYVVGSALLGARSAEPLRAAAVGVPVPVPTQCEAPTVPAQSSPSAPSAQEACAPASTVTAPTDGPLTSTTGQGSGQTVAKRAVRARAPNTREEPKAVPEPAAAPEPSSTPPSVSYESYPSRPLDSRNPYASKKN